MAENTLSDNITQAISDFNSIKEAIKEKDVEVIEGTPTSDYADLIRQIEGGGSGDLPSTCVLMKSSNDDDVIDTIVFKGMTSIPDYIFEASSYTSDIRYSQIKYLSFPNNLLTIGNSSFHNMCGLIDVVIPNTVTTIKQRAFYGYGTNQGPTVSIKVGNSIESIGSEAFRYAKLNSLNLGDNLKYLYGSAFSSAIINNFTISNNCKIQTIETSVFYDVKMSAEQMSNIVEHWYPKLNSDIGTLFYNNLSDTCDDLVFKFIFGPFFYSYDYKITGLKIEKIATDVIDEFVAPFGWNGPFKMLCKLAKLTLPAVTTDHETLTKPYNNSDYFLYNYDNNRRSPITDLILGDYESTDNAKKWAASVSLISLSDLTTDSAIAILNNLATVGDSGAKVKTITFNTNVMMNVMQISEGKTAISNANSKGWDIAYSVPQ